MGKDKTKFNLKKMGYFGNIDFSKYTTGGLPGIYYSDPDLFNNRI